MKTLQEKIATFKAAFEDLSAHETQSLELYEVNDENEDASKAIIKYVKEKYCVINLNCQIDYDYEDVNYSLTIIKQSETILQEVKQFLDENFPNVKLRTALYNHPTKALKTMHCLGTKYLNFNVTEEKIDIALYFYDVIVSSEQNPESLQSATEAWQTLSSLHTCVYDFLVDFCWKVGNMTSPFLQGLVKYEKSEDEKFIVFDLQVDYLETDGVLKPVHTNGTAYAYKGKDGIAELEKTGKITLHRLDNW